MLKHATFPIMANIAAIATGAQHCELGIIRLTGPTILQALRPYLSCEHFEPRIYTPCDFSPMPGLSYPAGLVYFKAPQSYTGEDVLELHLPGNPVLLDDICRELFRGDIAPAEPGEFTKRAFLNGKMDLTQARSVMQLIQSRDEAQRRHALTMLDGGTSTRLQEVAESLVAVIGLLQASLEFSPDEIGEIDPGEIHGLLRSAIDQFKVASPSESSEQSGSFTRVLISGAANTGKSSLFNALCGKRRSFISSEPHATRDPIEAVIPLDSGEICLVDSCGTHLADDEFRQGLQKQYRHLVDQADVMVVCFDGSAADHSEELHYYEALTLPKLAVVSHAPCDLGLEGVYCVDLSSAAGLDEFRRALGDTVAATGVVSLGAQWSQAHDEIATRLQQALKMLEMGEPEEFAVTFLEEAREVLDGLRGCEVSDDVLDGVFKRFCVGK